MRCSNCGTEGLVEDQITRTYGDGPTALVIHNVPILRCVACGEFEYPAATMEWLQALKNAHQGHEVYFPEKRQAA